LELILDPGHGGPDPGAVYAGGTVKEEYLNLVICNRVKSLIENYHRVLLTRYWGKKEETSLADRVKMANGINGYMKADFFLSVHHNSFSDSNVKGFEVFYTAGNKNAAGFAARMYYNINKISQTADYKYNMREIKGSAGGLYVLNDFYITVPAVLIELGFGTNAEELAWLTCATGQITLSYAIARTVLEHFWEMQKGTF
jgi:N-acetylmuramoyl-L-alanine amidase